MNKISDDVAAFPFERENVELKWGEEKKKHGDEASAAPRRAASDLGRGICESLVCVWQIAKRTKRWTGFIEHGRAKWNTPFDRRNICVVQLCRITSSSFSGIHCKFYSRSLPPTLVTRRRSPPPPSLLLLILLRPKLTTVAEAIRCGHLIKNPPGTGTGEGLR